MARIWKGPTGDIEGTTIRPLRPRASTPQVRQPHATSWSPFSPHSGSWNTGSVLQLVQERRNVLNASPTSPRLASPRRGLRSRDSSLSLPRSPGSYRDLTALARAHVWPPHSELTLQGSRHERDWRSDELEPAPSPPTPIVRIRSPLRDPRMSDVRGLRFGSERRLSLQTRPQSAFAPAPLRSDYHDGYEYVSPRPATASYGIASTHAGVGRAGFWGSEHAWGTVAGGRF